MANGKYYVKIVPQKGETVHRFHVTRRHIVAVASVLGALIFGSLAFAGVTVLRAHWQVASLQAQADKTQATLQKIDRQAQGLRKDLQHVQKQNSEIRQLIGAPPAKPTEHPKTSWVPGKTLPAVAAHVDSLTAQSIAMRQESDSMRTLALRVLNIRHIADLARAQLIAAIPSIDPVAGAEVIGCFCYRTYPDVGFHEGVDLGANYGDSVHASAAGTIVANSYDGGFGNKIDIDHGNGYHTWYAHLSHVDVAVGTHVYKGQLIGEVGSTGFSTGPHLHYQVMKNGTPVDPTPYLTGVPANVLASLP